MFGKLLSGRNKRAQASASDDLLQENLPVNAAPDEQLQNRIIAYFANGQNMNLIPAGPVEVTPAQRQKVIQDLQSGAISQSDLARFLEQILSPIQDLDANLHGIYQRIISDMRRKQIIAVAAGYNAKNWQGFNRDDLRKLITRGNYDGLSYQTPVGFAKFRIKFLDGIRKQASSEQFAEYVRTMDQLEKGLYDQRFAYYQQVQLLARNNTAAKTDNTDDSAIEAIIAEEVQSPASSEAQPSMSTSLLAITPERSNNLLSQAEINGDAWIQDGIEYRLSTANLINGNLVPAYETVADGRIVAFSIPFELSDGRGAIIAYVVSDNSVKVRSYYINPKTGFWYYAPDIIRGARGEGMGQIGEGYGLDSTILPAMLQQQLSGLVKQIGFQEITAVNPDFLFAGTAMAYNTQQEYREALASGNMRGDFYREIDREPINRSWQMRGNTKNVPQLISVNDNLHPDFQKLIGNFMTYSVLAGQVVVNFFPSQDGQEIWLFCNDELGRTWIGNIEIVSPVTSTGCRRDWLQAGDMVTPLYEHSTRVNNYGDPTDTRKGMMGMWNQYLSKIPLIQEYVNLRKG